MNARSTVLCVDDNPGIADAVRCVLSKDNRFDFIGHLETAEHLVSESVRLKPDLVLLDLDMPGRPPLDALTDLLNALPETRVIILSGYMSDDLIDRALDAGAWGYINKNDGPEAVEWALGEVSQGRFALRTALK